MVSPGGLGMMTTCFLVCGSGLVSAMMMIFKLGLGWKTRKGTSAYIIGFHGTDWICFSFWQLFCVNTVD